MNSRALSVMVNIGGKLLPSLNSSASAVEKRFGLMTNRMRLRAAEAKAAWRSTMAAASPLLGLAAAGGLMFSAKAAIGDSAHLAHELQMLRNAGRTTKEVASAMAAANRTISSLPTTTLLDNLKVINETTGAFGNFQHAVDNLEFNQKVGSMLQNMLGDKVGDPGEMFNSLVRGMEMRGAANDPRRYQREVSQLYRAMIFTRGNVNPGEFLTYSQTANPYTKGMSERYLTKIAPSLIQEFGGDRAGTMQNTFTGTILGKAKNKISTQAWIKLGLLDPKQVIYNKVGPVGFMPGAMKGTNLALQDPLAWSEKVLIPALKAHGFKTNDQLSLAKALMPLFRDRNANRLANVLTYDQDRARLHKDERLINQVPTLDQAQQDTLRRDPLMGLQAVKASLTNMLSTMFGTAKGDNPVAVALVHIANGINMVAQAFQAHPMLAKGVGALLLGSAGLATLKVLGIGLRFILSPLRGLFALLFTVGPRGIGVFGWILRGLSRLGPLIFRGLLALAPLVMEGTVAAFALLSNPVGWAIILGGVAIALVAYFRGPLKAAWMKGWNALKAWVLGINWGAVGMTIANALTGGLASKFASAMARIRASANVPGPAAKLAPNQVRLLAGARANGGPVLAGRRYLVGERGPEEVEFGHSGRVIPNHHIAAMAGGPRHYRPGRSAPLVGTLIVQGGNGSPAEIEGAVHRALKRLAGGQAALLSD